jgi:hypothetical protein
MMTEETKTITPSSNRPIFKLQLDKLNQQDQSKSESPVAVKEEEKIIEARIV